VPEQELYCTQITGSAVDQRHPRSNEVATGLRIVACRS
jgi:hypothetical protein